MNKVSPEFLPPEERPSLVPFPKEAIPELLKLKLEYDNALQSGSPEEVFKMREKIGNFLIETELLTPDRFDSLDPETQEAVIQAHKLTQDLYGKKAA